MYENLIIKMPKMFFCLNINLIVKNNIDDV